MTEEDEEFNHIERLSKIRQEYVRSQMPKTQQQFYDELRNNIIEEVALEFDQLESKCAADDIVGKRFCESAAILVRSVKDKAPKATVETDRHYMSGWNSALEMAAVRLEHDFKKAFGADTLSSIAIYIRGMKK
jgi:hypothetical protein